MSNLADHLEEGSIVVETPAESWRDAIALAGSALVASGATTDVYTNEMIEAVEKLGPYIVIAPGFALAHARPSPAVLRTGLSWVSLPQPVEFGHKKNDPVRLVVGLAALDHDAHLAVMSSLARVLASPQILESALAARSPAEVREILDNAS